jgi:hypothetical protein
MTVFVGKENQPFTIHKDLLILHAGYFRNFFHDAADDTKVALPNIKPSLFIDFISWLYTGKFLDVSNEALGGGPRTDMLWELGRSLRCPAFQNLCMDDCRIYCQDPAAPWPYVEAISTMYTLTKKGSLLRKFAAHSMMCKNPFTELEEGSREYKKWEKLLEKCPDLATDMVKGKNWNGTRPWDDEHRGAYMEEEADLDKRWDELILRQRTKAEIKKEADKKDIRSIIELEHLER